MSPRARKAQVESETSTASSAATEATPVATETVASEPIKVEAASKKDTQEVWWSMRARNHSLEVVAENGEHEMVRFENNTKRLDLSKPEDAAISKALRSSRAFKKDIFVVGEAAEGHMASSKEQQEFLRAMRVKVFTETGDVDPDGFASLRALFTNKELIEAGMNPNATDADALIILALKTKQLGGE